MERIVLSSQPPQPVLIIGSLAYDHILTPDAESGRIAGGSANFAAVAASHFAPARVVAVVGGDYDEGLLRLLQERGVDTSGVERDASGKTFFWRGKYGENFNRREALATDLNVFERFNPILPEVYRQSGYVMLGAIQPSLQMSVLDQLDNKKAFVLADTIQLWIDQKRSEVLELLKRVGMVCLNDDEATILTGERNLFKAGQWLQTHTAPIVLLKKGEHGSVLFHPDGVFMLPAYPVTGLKDPTGAGDSFAGALIGALAAQNAVTFEALKRAMVYATAVGSLTVEEFSFDRIASPQAGSEIMQRVEKLRALTAFR